jgi:hypothetical protein
MPTGPRQRSPAEIRAELESLLAALDENFDDLDLRIRVQELIPIFRNVRELGSSLQLGRSPSGKGRILAYLRRYLGQRIDGDELMVISGIGEWARRVRELRVQEGWPILSGVTVAELRVSLEEEGTPENEMPPPMRPSEYLLERDEQDTDAAARWQTTNGIRRGAGSVKDKILKLLRAYVGEPIHSEVLRYVAGEGKSEWARRARELRTEEGWPVVTKSTGDPSLPVAVYMLAKDEQAPPHDRHIPADVRGVVMKRDDYSCRWEGCGWPVGFNAEYDHRFLEVHHIQQHVHGGSNIDPDNLVTLCNVHHDVVHGGTDLTLKPKP